MMNKEDMEKRLSRLEEMITYPDHYGLRIHQIDSLRKELETLTKEYLNLPPEVKQLLDIHLKTRITYESDNNHYRIVYAWGRWNLYDGIEYIKNSKIEFLDGKPIKATYPYIGSETHGKVVQYTFNIILDQEVPKQERPSKISDFKISSPEEVRKGIGTSVSAKDLEAINSGPLNTNLAMKDTNIALVKRGKADNNFIRNWLNRNKR